MGAHHGQTDVGIEYQGFLDEIGSELVDPSSMAKGFLSKKRKWKKDSWNSMNVEKTLKEKNYCSRQQASLSSAFLIIVYNQSKVKSYMFINACGGKIDENYYK